MSTTMAIPAVEVVAGAPLPVSTLARLLSVRVAARLSTPTQCELTFAAPVPDHPFALGGPLSVGVVGDVDRLIEGEVTALEHVHGGDGESRLRIRAYDRLHRLRKRQDVRVLENVTVEEVARTVAAAADLPVSADAAGPRWLRLFQHRQSDFELLRDVCERSGLYFVVRDGELRLLTLDGTGEPVVLMLGSTLHEARVEINMETAGGTVGAFGWDPGAAEGIEADVASARVGRSVGVDADPSAVGLDGRRVLVDQPGLSADHVEAVAQGWLDHRTAQSLTFRGVAEGDGRLHPGGRVEVRGLATEVSGTYVLTEVVHTIDAAGYRTALSTAPPPLRPRPTAASVTLGRVASVEDPEGLGRVQVAMPGYGDVETTWMGVVMTAAGPDKGLVALPDVDDKVLVVLPHEDPAEGLVLGGLYGTVAPPDPGVDGGGVRRYTVRTPGGQIAVLDDGEKQVRLANSGGSRVELAPERVTVHAATDLLIEAPGRSITIKARAVDFVETGGES